jgi:type IV fimbrial biogenesis protein FimT
MQAINFARSQAIFSGREVILCASSDGQTCSADWSKGMLVFAKAVFKDSMQYLLRVYGPLSSEESITWNRVKNEITFSPLGTVKEGNGTFTYSSKEANQKPLRLIMSRTGRVRLEEMN